MVRVLVFYATPDDPAEFDRRYEEEHIPLTWRLPGLQAFRVSRGPVSSTQEPAPYLIATLEYASPEAAESSLSSPEGVAGAAHAAEIATGGMWFTSYEEADTVPAAA
jgi:uncharacterized protein (TIGR02118 family)